MTIDSNVMMPKGIVNRVYDQVSVDVVVEISWAENLAETIGDRLDVAAKVVAGELVELGIRKKHLHSFVFDDHLIMIMTRYCSIKRRVIVEASKTSLMEIRLLSGEEVEVAVMMKQMLGETCPRNILTETQITFGDMRQIDR